LRVFNGNGEPVPFALERPVVGTMAGTAKALPVFALQGDSNAALDALRVTIESGSGAINVHTAGQATPSDRASRQSAFNAPSAYAWKTGLLWAILIAGAALLAWMALRLFREFR
jgi:hypothetical protein